MYRSLCITLSILGAFSMRLRTGIPLRHCLIGRKRAKGSRFPFLLQGQP